MQDTSSTDPADHEVSCPYCDEDDFDLIGLKSHLLNHCVVFESTPDAQALIRTSLIQPSKPTP